MERKNSIVLAGQTYRIINKYQTTQGSADVLVENQIPAKTAGSLVFNLFLSVNYYSITTITVNLAFRNCN